MRIRLLLAIGLMMLLAPGCTSSVNELCSPDGEQAVFDPALLGVWNNVPPTAKTGFTYRNDANTITTIHPPTISLVGPSAAAGDKEVHPIRLERLKEGTKTYRITNASTAAAKDEAAPAQQYRGTLVALGAARFLDLSLANPRTEREKSHVFFRVQIGPEILTLGIMNPNYLAAHPEALAHRREVEGGPIPVEMQVMTAPSAAIRDFFERHRDDQEVWPEALTVRYARSRPAEAPPVTGPGTPHTPPASRPVPAPGRDPADGR